jgi:hypothetical protein
VSKNGENMYFEIRGLEGEYIIKNESSILQYKLDENGQKTGESIMHIITDSIENNEDRNRVTKKIVE